MMMMMLCFRMVNEADCLTELNVILSKYMTIGADTVATTVGEAQEKINHLVFTGSLSS
jgi:polyhydroxyalkanoate synthesis regulator phasin